MNADKTVNKKCKSRGNFKTRICSIKKWVKETVELSGWHNEEGGLGEWNKAPWRQGRKDQTASELLNKFKWTDDKRINKRNNN